MRTYQLNVIKIVFSRMFGVRNRLATPTFAWCFSWSVIEFWRSATLFYNGTFNTTDKLLVWDFQRKLLVDLEVGRWVEFCR